MTVLNDPDAVAIIRAVEKHNCRNTLELNWERVDHFVERVAAHGLTGRDVVIVLINVDDIHGHDVADTLMPGADWQAIRDRGEVPFARGLAGRDGIQNVLALFDNEAALKLREHKGLAVVVIDHTVAEVFDA